MPNTRGYEVVAEITLESLKSLLKSAWKEGGDTSDEGVIPEKIDIPGPSVPAPVMVGPYKVKSGMIQIPQEQLDLTMDTGINGVKVKLGSIIHLEIENPPVDAAKLFDLTADVFVRTPLSARNNDEIIADFTALPADGVTINITSGNPLTPIISQAVEQYVHQKYQDNTIPHTIDNININILVFNMTCRVDFFDDLADPANKIIVSRPDPAHLKIDIPTRIRFYNITGSQFGVSLATPMAVTGRTIMLADYTETESNISVKLGSADVQLTNLTPAPGVEGANYTSNKNTISIIGQNLDNLVITAFNANATSRLRAVGDINLSIPTLAQIEAFAAGAVKTELIRRKQIQIWKVEEIDGTDTPINNVKPQALADGMAIAINDMGGGNSGSLNNFIPGNRDFAIATAAEKVMAVFNKEKNERYNFPHTFPDKIEGKTVKLNSLGLELHNGFFEVKGNITVVDAVLDSIDISADFSQNVSLFWDPNAAPGQKIQHKLEGDPDIDLGAAAWILTAIIGFLTFGVVGLIIGLIIVAVVEGVASQIGAQVAAGEADKFDNAWPVVLDKIGNIEAHFHNPIGIETTGLLFAGQMVITAFHQSTLIDAARSNGPYSATGNQLINFTGGAPQAVSAAKWQLGDGQVQNVRSLSYRYGKSGVYVASLQIQVNQEGGATTRHYTAVNVKNVQPVVKFTNPSLTIPEGQETEIIVTFTDDNWLDKHIAVFDFGDNTAPVNGTVVQTNDEPQAKGTASVKHTWCDSGSFIVSVHVHDDAGGVGSAEMNILVTNVPPKIIAPKKICVLRNQHVHLEAIFTDPGWCDTHVATWDTGDGHTHMATIKERHTPPALIGFASSSHVYTCIGNYIAQITVTDKDGGEDSAMVYVKVTELFNADFEKGFRIFLQNKERLAQSVTDLVANEWHPFKTVLQTATPSTNNNVPAGNLQAMFNADEFILRSGQRSQVVTVNGSGMAGIRQTVCANPGWDYEFTAYYHLPSINRQCMLIIGINPAGGTDPLSTDIQWVMAPSSAEWVHASVRVCAKEEKITCFVGVLQAGGTAELYLDKTALYMIQPKYGAVPDRKKEVENCCPVEEIHGHNFNRLENYSSVPTMMSRYQGSSEGVKFSMNEQLKPQVLIAQAPSNTLAETVIKGATQLTGAIVKNLVSGTITTILPFLKKK